MNDVVLAFGRRKVVEQGAACLPESGLSSCCRLPEQGLELGKELLDRVEIRGIGRVGFPLWRGSPALLVELKASGVQQHLGVPRLCRFFAPPRSRTGSRRQGCPKLRLLPTGSQLSD